MTVWIKAFMAAHTFLIQRTKGRLGSKAGKHAFLLLHTKGRKTGQPYVTPLSYFQDGPGYVVVASNWGKGEHPAWFQNLTQQPITTIQVGEDQIQVTAHSAEAAEYERLWKFVTSKYAIYRTYQGNIERRIPIVILKPAQHPG
jgi:deazaflavin-dependent oxidoreductase (nitroreductase family)